MQEQHQSAAEMIIEKNDAGINQPESQLDQLREMRTTIHQRMIEINAENLDLLEKHPEIIENDPILKEKVQSLRFRVEAQLASFSNSFL